MGVLPPDVLTMIGVFAPLVSERVWQRAQVLLIGALLVPGRRTVASVLRVMGLAGEIRFKHYHRVLSRARWSALAGSRLLLRQWVNHFVPEGPVVVGIDDTIERRWGRRIGARGIYRDPVRSSRGHVVKVSGLRWLSVMLLTPIPWAVRVWALPFLTVSSPSERYDTRRGRAHQPLTVRARQVLRLLHRWLPERRLIAVADSGYAALELLAALPAGVAMITRLRLDAALYAPPPERPPGRPGRPRKKGQRWPSLEHVAVDPATRWQALTVPLWYGRRNHRIAFTTATALWYHSGLPPVAIRWVLIRDPQKGGAPQALLSTDRQLDPVAIIGYFIRRWQVEVTFEESRRHLGVESQRQWSDRAIARTTPVLFALFSITTLIADRLQCPHPLPLQRSAWYTKPQPTFADALAAVRRAIWLSPDFCTSPSETETVEIPTALRERWFEAVCYAA